MKIAILGAGNVALANAWFLAQAGHDVHVWSAFEAERTAIAAAGGLDAEGCLEGHVKVAVAADAGTCIAGAALVMIAAPAFAHRALMSAAAPHLSEHQDVLVHPVTGLSSLLLSGMLKARGVKPTIVDVSTSLFTTRKTGPTSMRILKLKDVVDIAAIPAERGRDAMQRLQAIFGPRFRLEDNALAISLNNHNPVYHVPPLLCNLSRAEKGENWIIWECITPGVARLVKLVDEERLALVRRFGTTEISVDDYFRQAHGAEGRDLDEIFAAVARKLKGPVGPQEFNHRFITEDVPYALVFYRSLGSVAGVEMPLIDALIRLSSALYGRDFTAEGHTLERLGLGGLASRDILAVTTHGF
jgi:opine dehydrogenase